MICLANSRKFGGRCIAGKATANGAWIRPISARNSAEINFDERQYENGQEPQILDVVVVSMIGPSPRGHQQENHLIDADYYWKKKREVAWNELDALTDASHTLWTNGHSTHGGRNDRVPAADAEQYQTSLCLIHPRQVTISVQTPGAAFGNDKKAVRAQFRYNGLWYNLRATDVDVERVYSAKEVGAYPLELPCYLCISLAEAHTDDYCYKLVATIITEQAL
jgi:hypothetical protein